MPTRLVVLASLCVLSRALSASPLLWHNESISVLQGDHYEVTPARQTTVTLETASGWAWGDMFAFVDFINFNDSSCETAVYGEITPRWSTSWLSGKQISAGIIDDVMLITGYEAGRGDVETGLLGAGFNLNVNRFTFLHVDLIQRLPNGGRDGETVQITTAWAYPFSIGSIDALIDGYTDWVVNSDGSFHRNLHFNPQIKVDLGKIVGMKKGSLWTGLEYDYWHNKFGIKNSSSFDTDQSAFSALIKYHF